MDASTTSSTTEHQRPHVLVVEDEHALRHAVTRYLTQAGFDVSEAASGREALEQLDEHGVDVVLSDIMMPDMDGIKLLRGVRERDLDLPVVLSTGAPTVESAAAAVEHGALAYLVKPVELGTLAAIARRASMLYAIARAKRTALAMSGQPSQAAGDLAGLETTFEQTLETLWIAFQPLIATRRRTMFGFEALMRSDHRALPHPGAVLEAAERLGQLGRLGRTLRDRTASAFARAESDATLFVNLHPNDLGDDALFDVEAGVGAIAHRVVLEITERASLRDVKDVRSRVSRLRDIGYRIAVDDLGAGYAGLSSFADLEPEIVKLDMSLVRDLDKVVTKQKLVRSMTALCHDLGIEVVAEGIETAAERDQLVDMGVDYLQGYLFAKPGRPFPAWSWGQS